MSTPVFDPTMRSALLLIKKIQSSGNCSADSMTDNDPDEMVYFSTHEALTPLLQTGEDEMSSINTPTSKTSEKPSSSGSWEETGWGKRFVTKEEREKLDKIMAERVGGYHQPNRTKK